MGDWFSESHSSQSATVHGNDRRAENEASDRARWANDAAKVRASLAPWRQAGGESVHANGQIVRFAQNAGERPEFGGNLWRVTLALCIHPKHGRSVEVLGQYDWDRSRFVALSRESVLSDLGRGWQISAEREVIIGGIVVWTSTDGGHGIYDGTSLRPVGIFFRGSGGCVMMSGDAEIGEPLTESALARVKIPDA